MSATADRQRAIAVALYARRFTLLAVDSEYRSGGEVRCAALDADMSDELVGLSELVQIAFSGPMDALCAEAVAAINTPGQPPDLRQFLTLLPEDRALGIFYALQPPKRKTLLRHAYWRELVAAGPAADLIQQAGMDVADADADALGVSAWTRETIAIQFDMPTAVDGGTG